MKKGGVLLITGYAEMVQHISPINKSVLQDILVIWRKQDEFKYVHKKSCVIYSYQESFYPKKILNFSCWGYWGKRSTDWLYLPTTESKFSQVVLLVIEAWHKTMNFSSRQPEVTNLATFRTKWGGGERIMQGTRLWHCINIFQISQLFSLPRQIKPAEESSLNKILVQDHQAIYKCKDN